VLDGAVGPDYLQVSVPSFSEDSRHLYYRAKVECAVELSTPGTFPPTGWRTVLDDREAEVHAGVTDFTVDYDGCQHAYVARSHDNEASVVVNGSPVPYGDSVEAGTLVLSRELGRYAFLIRDTLRRRAVVDGIVGAAHEDLRAHQFSPDGHEFSYITGYPEDVLILNNRVHATADRLEPPVYDSTGRCRAFVSVTDGKREVVVQQGRKERRFETIGTPTQLTLSPSGGRFAWVDNKPLSGVLLMVDGRRVAEYDNIGLVTFSPLGNRLAYAAWDRGQWTIVVDSVPAGRHEAIRDLLFSPDERHWACWSRDGGDWYVLVDGAPGLRYDEPVSRVVFTGNDGVRYIGRRARTYHKTTRPLTP